MRPRDNLSNKIENNEFKSSQEKFLQDTKKT